MKTYIIVNLCCIAVYLLAKPNQGAPQNERTATDHAPHTVTFINNEESTAKTETAQASPPRWYTALKRPDWWLVIVAALTGLAIAYQGKEMTRATKQMKISVEVALAENRPWLLPHLQEGKDRIQEPYLKPVGSVPEGELRFSHCVFFFKNYRQTPAKALMLRAELRIGDNPNAPPSSDIYDVTKVKFNPFIFPQGEAVPHSAPLTPNAFITDQELGAITNGIRFLWLQGIVRYRHTIETEILSDAPDFETKFCYVWETRLNTPKPIWRLAGPAGTNTAT